MKVLCLNTKENEYCKWVTCQMVCKRFWKSTHNLTCPEELCSASLVKFSGDALLSWGHGWQSKMAVIHIIALNSSRLISWHKRLQPASPKVR